MDQKGGSAESTKVLMDPTKDNKEFIAVKRYEQKNSKFDIAKST